MKRTIKITAKSLGGNVEIEATAKVKFINLTKDEIEREKNKIIKNLFNSMRCVGFNSHEIKIS